MEKCTVRYGTGWYVQALPMLFLAFMPMVVRAQDTTWIDKIASETLGVLEAGIPVLVGLGLALFIWGGVVMIVSAGDDTKRKEGQTRMLWGLLALFVLVSVWGIVKLVQVFLGVGGTTSTPPLPGVEIDDGYIPWDP